MFQTRHGLLAVRDHGRAQPRGVRPDGEDRGRSGRTAARTCSRTSSTSSSGCGPWRDGQKEYLQGTIEFYQARTNTKMTIAAERLAVIAAVTLPITALSSIYGMNVIVNDQTHYGQLFVALGVMAVMSAPLLVWSKRKGWWGKG